jgi:hypothetical protein
MMVAILTLMVGAGGMMPKGDIPWPTAWIFFLPSLIALHGTGNQKRTFVLQLVLGFAAGGFLLALTHFGSGTPVDARCAPGLAGYWVAGGSFCPNLFEYYWGFAGKLVPVAYATMLASIGHIALRHASARVQNARIR